MKDHHVKLAALAAAAVAALGSVTPWITASGFISLSVAGTEGDGKITLVIAIIAAVLAGVPAFPTRTGLRILVALAGLGIAGVCVNMLRQIYSERGDTTGDFPLFVSPGWGLWICTLAGATLAVVPLLRSSRTVAPVSTLVPGAPLPPPTARP